jgi:DNA-binding transcriptional LysR family regulator
MRFRQLKTFVAAADAGNFGLAAERLNMTPPAVSLQMKALEEALATELFDRTVRPTQLTPQGRALLPDAREIVSRCERLMIQAAGDTLRGKIRIGAVGSTLTGNLPRALASLRSHHPNLDFEVEGGFSIDLLARLKSGELDVALMSEPRTVQTDFAWQPVASEMLVVIAPINCIGNYDEEVLTTYPYIRFDRRAWYSELVEKHLKRRKIKVDVKMEFGTLEAVTTMVFFGHGVSVVPQRFINNPFSMPLKSIPFGHPPVTRDIGILWRRGHEKTSLIEAFLSELLSQHGLERQGS